MVGTTLTYTPCCPVLAPGSVWNVCQSGIFCSVSYMTRPFLISRGGGGDYKSEKK